MAAPVLHGDDVQVGADLIFGVEHLRQLAERHGISHGHREISDEGGAVPVEHRPCDDVATEWIWPVEHKEWNVPLRRFLQAIGHRRNKGVKASPGVLDVKDQRIEILKHLGRRSACWAIKTVNGQARSSVMPVGNYGIRAAQNSVLGTEQLLELHARSPPKDVGRAPALEIYARL